MTESKRTKTFTIEEVSTHNERGDCWIIIDGVVCDVTSFLGRHPGGEMTITRCAGEDATNEFEAVGHSVQAKKLIRKYAIGRISTASSSKALSTSIDVKDDMEGFPPQNVYHADRSKRPEKRSSHCPIEKVVDNVWTRENGGGLIGKDGRRFGPGSFGLHQMASFMYPAVMKSEYEPPTNMKTRPYWFMLEANDPTSVRRRLMRFHLFKDILLLMILFSSSFLGAASHIVAAAAEATPLEAFGSIADLVTLATFVGCPLSFAAFGCGLLSPKTFLRALLDIKIVLYSAAFWFAMCALCWICAMGNWLVLRSLPVFVEAAFLNFPIRMKDQGKGSWYSGWIKGCMFRGGLITVPLLLQMLALEGAPNGRYDVLALVVFGVSLVTMCALSQKMRPHYDGRVHSGLRLAVATWTGVGACFLRAAFVRRLGLQSDTWIPSIATTVFGAQQGERANEMWWDASFDLNIQTIYALTCFLLLSLCVRNLMDQIVICGEFDPMPCQIHVLTFPFASLAFPIAFLCSLGTCLWYGLVSNGLWFALTYWSCYLLYSYYYVLTDNSIKNIDRPPRGTNCVHICDESLTRSEMECELGLSSVFGLGSQIIATNFCAYMARSFLEMANQAMFGKLMFYLHETPILDLKDESVEVGVAYCVTPKDAQQRPETFVCNVGHMDMMTPTCADWLTTNMHTYRMIESIANDPKAGSKGFVSQVIAEFHRKIPVKGDPKNKLRRVVRQVNLSAWASAKSAHDWYVASRAHRDIVTMLKSDRMGLGGLSTFSSLLAHLSATPGHKMRWFAKCSRCGGLQTKYPDVKTCPKCKSPVSMRHLM